MRSHLVLILAVCALSIVLSAVRCAHVAAQADFEAVADAVRGAYRDGDLVVVVPFHQAVPRTLLGDLPLIEPRKVEPEMLRMHARLLVIAVDGFGLGSLDDELFALGEVTPLAAHGDVSASVVTVREHVVPAFDLRRDLGMVRVAADYGSPEATPCAQWNGSRWTCPRDSDWSYVGRVTLNLEDGPRACVWMHPLNGGHELTVTLPEVSGSSLLLGHGFVLSAQTRQPVQVEVRRGRDKLYDADAEPHTGWQTHVVPLDRGSGPVTLAVQTRDNAAAHFCMDAWVLP